MEAIYLGVGFLWLVFSITWMLQMLKSAKASRILHSMTLMVILKICEDKNINIDIQKIQKEVESKI